MRSHGKHLDFEVNLIPFIDLLSTCICFLLLTAVWLQVASMDVKQAVGGAPAADAPKRPAVWARLEPGGALRMEFQDAPASLPASFSTAAIPARDGKPDLEGLAAWIDQARARVPELSTALIQPNAVSSFEDIIALMDELRRLGLADLGVAPL
jgi:biopolymer transport protein ExbD